MGWKKFRLIWHDLDLYHDFLIFQVSQISLISRKKLFVSKSLPERFKCRPSFQRCSFFDIRVINKMEIVQETFSFQSFIHYTGKSRVSSSVYSNCISEHIDIVYLLRLRVTQKALQLLSFFAIAFVPITLGNELCCFLFYPFLHSENFGLCQLLL